MNGGVVNAAYERRTLTPRDVRANLGNCAFGSVMLLQSVSYAFCAYALIKSPVSQSPDMLQLLFFYASGGDVATFQSAFYITFCVFFLSSVFAAVCGICAVPRKRRFQDAFLLTSIPHAFGIAAGVNMLVLGSRMVYLRGYGMNCESACDISCWGATECVPSNSTQYAWKGVEVYVYAEAGGSYADFVDSMLWAPFLYGTPALYYIATFAAFGNWPRRVRTCVQMDCTDTLAVP